MSCYKPFLFLFCVILCAGCIKASKVNTAPQNDNKDLFAQWQKIPQKNLADMDVVSATKIARQMALSGPDGLDPFFDLLADPNAAPTAKTLVIISLTPLATKDRAEQFTSRLLPLTAEGMNQQTRSCATHLLGLLGTPAADKRVEELSKDPDKRIHISAVLIQLLRRNPEALKEIHSVWSDPDTNRREKDQIVLLLPATADNMDIFKQAVNMADLDPQTRLHAVDVLGQWGDPSVVEPLQTASEKDAAPEVRDLARKAAEAVKAKAAQK